MTLTVSSTTLSDYDAHLAFKTATAFLRKSDLADYLIAQLEKQAISLSIEINADPALTGTSTYSHGKIFWNLYNNDCPSLNLDDVAALFKRIPPEQQDYLATYWALMHLLAMACQDLDSQLNFRDGIPAWPWLDDESIEARDIENVVARELIKQPLPEACDWRLVIKPA